MRQLNRRTTASKYNNQKTYAGGETFDSMKEAQRYNELLLLLRAGQIKDLQRQVKFVLIPNQREPDTVGPRGGIHKGETIEKECSYYADFVYRIADSGEIVVEDVKSEATRTEAYRIKKKLMLKEHGIRIKEID